MIHRHHEHEPDRPDTGRVTSRWRAVGLVAMTGLALTAAGVAVPSAANAVVHTPTSIGPDRPDRSFTDDDRGEHDDGKHDDTDRTKDDKGKTKKARKPKAIPVPCNTDKLIAAITLANARGGAVLDLAKDCTYLLTANIDGAGLPAVTTPITLNGGDKNTTIKRASGAEQFRILTVDIGGYLTLNHLTIIGGQTTGDGGGILVNAGAAAAIGHSKILNNISSQNGGGISSSGATHLKNSTVKGNVSSSRGGGIENTGTLTLRQSNIKRNSASVAGGVQHGIPGGIPTAGTLTIISSNVAENQAQRHGGMLISTGTGMIKDSKVVRNISLLGSGITSAAQLALLDSRVADNVATGGVGGGMILAANSYTSIRNSIIEGNVGLTGGGIYNEGELTIAWTKIVDNRTTTLGGGGIYNRSTGMVNLFATKVIKNIAATDGGGIFNEAGGTVNLNTATGTVVVRNRPNNCFNVPGCFG
ncbi:hypothetical protein [Salinispora arenicola]|uniref:hypothetical protein n=1 Tax=Salinispora arenicola TaxID=168697 RepID=UPI0003687C48